MPEETTPGEQRKAKSVWQKTPTANLIRYVPKGTYYLRARVRGQIVRESLKTTKYEIAKMKLSERLRELRISSGGAVDCVPETLLEALALIETRIGLDPNLKTRSKGAYREALARLKPGGGATAPSVPLLKLTPEILAEWWSRASATYGPQSANHLLMFTKQALKLAKHAGGIFKDPSENLKRLRIPRTRLELPTVEQFRALVKSIRSQIKNPHRTQSANWIEFMAFSGMRPAEIAEIRWEHIDERQGVISVYGGAEGTKGNADRHVPIIPPMKDLLERMREGKALRVGKMFTIRCPSVAWRSACERVGIKRQRIYDLRHLFATTCRDSGVPVPTFAEWLGHKDGGALAMRTYVQKSDEHSKAAAAKVKF
jgi:integrase